MKNIIYGFLMATVPCVSSVLMVKHLNHFDRSYKTYYYGYH